jgi:hypothetical protein
MDDITGSLGIILGKSQGTTVLTFSREEVLTADRTPSILHIFESYVNTGMDLSRKFLATEFPESAQLGPLEEANRRP